METSLTWIGRLTGSPTDADWRQLLDVYGPLLRGWLTRTGVAAADHDDLCQEVLMVVVARVYDFDHRGPGAFRGWLRGILANRVGDYLRRERGRAAAGGGSDAHERLEALADPDSHLSRLWDREHDAHLTARAMTRVRPDFTEATWEAFLGQARDGRPARDVAAELGLTVNAVLVAKSRVLRRLREDLAGLVG
ncbi:MAG TPA: sigma-70 family RNA polymerase sigma factor [Urbifossiella sp.]|nr:sigma-70 family RNA polymerase sigma factor [Urbifossiella sp.]